MASMSSYSTKQIGVFEQNIATLISEITAFKEKYSKTLWCQDYEDILTELYEINDYIQYNFIDAEMRFGELPIATYETFQSYVYHTNAKSISYLKCNTERTKTLRAKRRNIICPICSNKLNIINNTMQCNSCGYIQEGKLATQSTRTISNNTKHICKQLDALTGARKAPANISKIIDYITIWLTEPKYIAEWLKSKDNMLVLETPEDDEDDSGSNASSNTASKTKTSKTKSSAKASKAATKSKRSRASNKNSFDKWIKKYNECTEEFISDSFFMRSIERTPANVPDYNVFKLFMDEFYALLEHCHRCAKEVTSNMEALTVDEQYKVFESYAKANKFKIPEIFEKYVYDGKEYEIGLMFNTLSLIVNESLMKASVIGEEQPQINVESLVNKAEEQRNVELYLEKLISLKKKLEVLYRPTLNSMRRRSLTIPGLMFNYRTVYSKSEAPPKKYCYQQEYCWLMNRVFNTPFVQMPKQDKDDIIKIILKFNEFYKDKICKQEEKSCNSPLYCCTIVCVLNLPYFQKYKNMLKFVPVKDNSTIASIRKTFFEFEIQHVDFIKPFKNKVRMVVEDSVESVGVDVDTVSESKPKRGGRKKKTSESDGTGDGVESKPKRGGRKKKDSDEDVESEPKKRGRKKKSDDGGNDTKVESEPKKRGRKRRVVEDTVETTVEANVVEEVANNITIENGVEIGMANDNVNDMVEDNGFNISFNNGELLSGSDDERVEIPSDEDDDCRMNIMDDEDEGSVMNNDYDSDNAQQVYNEDDDSDNYLQQNCYGNESDDDMQQCFNFDGSNELF